MSVILALWAACAPTVSEPCGLEVDDAGVRLAGCEVGLDLAPRVLADGAVVVALRAEGDAVVPTLTAGPGGATWRGLALEGGWSVDGSPRLLRQGYQSWSWSGVVELGDVELGADALPEIGGDGDSASFVEDRPWASWWSALVGAPGGDALHVGARSARQTKVWTAFSRERAWVVWGGRGERVRLEEGESLELDPVAITIGREPAEILGDYARSVGTHAPPAPPPVGWSSWTVWYSGVTEADVRAQIEAARALGDGVAPLTLLQVDDGWERRWGEWTANERFPSGMGALARDVAAAGLRPGLWMAPFYVDVATETYAAHPDWFVRGEDGEILTSGALGAGPYAILDATHPEAGAWMAQQVADRVAEGWTWLKLDFLYAGAQEGRRREDVTGVQAFHRGMALLREAAGDAWIAACGAPMLPTVGYAQSFRSGADIAFEVARDPDRAFLRWQARNTAARSWQSGVWWWIDPDSVMVRAPFDLDAARGAAAAGLAAGGPWLLGDDLAALDAGRLGVALAPEVVGRLGQVATPRDLLASPSGFDPSPIAERVQRDDQVPVAWDLPDGTVILLNLGDEEAVASAPGGRELLTGAIGGGGRVLAPGVGEVWVPDAR